MTTIGMPANHKIKSLTISRSSTVVLGVDLAARHALLVVTMLFATFFRTAWACAAAT
jgi:hypothetical protein